MKTLHKFCLCAAAILLCGFSLYAQETVLTVQKISASGTVMDKTFGEPVIGAAVIVPGTELGTITDIDGHFELSVPQGATLQFSSVGMKTVNMAAAEDMLIVLEDDTNYLEEVVVTGYMAEKKADLTGSVAVVKMKDVADVPTGNVMQALQGRVAGMNVTTDGTPGGGNTSTLVRGTTTINNSSPLYVIDGMPTRDNVGSILASSNYRIAEYPESLSQEAAREAVRRENRLECAMEGERFFDLVRWGIAADVMNSFFACEKDNRVYYEGASFTAGKDEYLPITNNQYKFSGRNYVQNPGYGQF